MDESKSKFLFLLPAAAVAVCLLPFVNKAIHIDDPLFVWAAQQIQHHPLDFYGFDVNWYGRDMPMSEVMKNPPLASYYIAIIASVFGFHEIPLHAGFILPAAIAATGIFFLARQFETSPLLAALTAMLTPVFLVSSTTLMCDIIMLAFWVWAVFFWIKGTKIERGSFLFIAALLIALSALTKYFGVALIPLLAVYSLAEKRRLGKWIFYFLIPIVLLAAYQLLAFFLYGENMLGSAAIYALKRGSIMSYFHRGMITLIFAGGCFLPILFYGSLIWSIKILRLWLAVSIVVLLIILYLPAIGVTPLWNSEHQYRWNIAILCWMMFMGGLWTLGLVVAEFYRQRDSLTSLLLAWIVGTVVFTAFVNWSSNGRSLLPMVPAVGILITRRIQEKKINPRIAYGCLLPAAIIALLTTWADYVHASSVRMAVMTIRKDPLLVDKKVWFQGHWGFQYYMQQAGYTPMNFEKNDMQAGEIILFPWNNINTSPLRKSIVSMEKKLEFSPCRWIATMNEDAGAGFYSDRIGVLPFVFGYIPEEKYYILMTKPPLPRP